MINKKFNKLKVLIEVERLPKGGHRQFKCLCDCGKETIATKSSLLNNSKKSCGCLVYSKNGLSDSPEYEVYHAFLQRCNNPKNKKFKYYGGRGIKVCNCIDTFEKFYQALGQRPNDEYSINRIDNDKNYCICENNLKWSLLPEQNRNRRLPHFKKNKWRGVIYMEARKVFWARLGRKFLGSFKTEDEAREKVLEAYYNFHGTFPPEYKPIPIPKGLLCA